MSRRKLTTAQTAVFMAILTLCAKFFGFIRELVMANYFGAGMVTDAFSIASTIPDYFIASIVSAVAVSYMPVFAEKNELEGRESAELFTSQLINFLVIVYAALIGLGLIFADKLVALFAPGFAGETAALTVHYLKISFLVSFSNILVYILGAYLQYKEIFLPQIIFGYVQNAIVIAAIIFSYYVGHEHMMWGVVIAHTVRSFFEIFLVRKVGYRHKMDFRFSATVKKVAALSVPVFLGGYVAQINHMLDKYLASTLPTGSVSALSYGNLISGLITGITTSIIVTVIYPKLNKAFATNDIAHISELSEKCMNLIFVITVPFTLGAFLYSSDVVQVMYERGAFDAAATNLTASAFAYYAIGGICFVSVNNIITKIFYSLHDTKTPVYCSLVSVAVNVVLNFVLIKYMAHAGLALATSIAQIVNSVLLYIVFQKKYGEITLLHSKKKMLLVCAFSVISVGISYAVWTLLSAAIVSKLVVLLATVLVAVVIYIVLLKLGRFDELNLLTELVKRKE